MDRAFLSGTDGDIPGTPVVCLFHFCDFPVPRSPLRELACSPFGRTFQAIRDNPERCEALGVNVKRHQLIGLVFAAFFAGVAGSLFVVVEGSVFPDLLFWSLSLEVFIMCLLGGWFIFLGPMFGAAAIHQAIKL